MKRMLVDFLQVVLYYSLVKFLYPDIPEYALVLSGVTLQLLFNIEKNTRKKNEDL